MNLDKEVMKVQLFDISRYELPNVEMVEWTSTRYNVGVFLSAYRMCRERMKLSPYPKMTVDALLGNQEAELRSIEGQNKHVEETYQEFLHNQHCFEHGYSAIMHPYRPEVTERRRKIFFYRFLYGLPVIAISERIHYQKNVIVDESKMAMLQFASAVRS